MARKRRGPTFRPLHGGRAHRAIAELVDDRDDFCEALWALAAVGQDLVSKAPTEELLSTVNVLLALNGVMSGSASQDLLPELDRVAGRALSSAARAFAFGKDTPRADDALAMGGMSVNLHVQTKADLGRFIGARLSDLTTTLTERRAGTGPRHRGEQSVRRLIDAIAQDIGAAVLASPLRKRINVPHGAVVKTIGDHLRTNVVAPLRGRGSDDRKDDDAPLHARFDPNEEAVLLLRHLGMPAKIAHNAVNAADAMALKRRPSNKTRAR